jgi:hypothetical protein
MLPFQRICINLSFVHPSLPQLMEEIISGTEAMLFDVADKVDHAENQAAQNEPPGRTYTAPKASFERALQRSLTDNAIGREVELVQNDSSQLEGLTISPPGPATLVYG